MPTSSTPLLVIGSLAFDSIETPQGKVEHILGGSCHYFSLAASFFSPVKILATVGEDFPTSDFRVLENHKIDTSGIEIQKGKTFFWKGRYKSDLQDPETLQTDLNVFRNFHPKLSEKDKKTPYLFLANIDPRIQKEVLLACTQTKLTACDSMNYWIHTQRPLLEAVFEQVDLISLNETETRLYSQKRSMYDIRAFFTQKHLCTLLIKRGEYGAVLFDTQGTFLIPAFLSPNIVDPTGAGDSFAGAMMGYCAQKKLSRKLQKENPTLWFQTLKEAVLYGCVVASFTIEQFGFKKLLQLTFEEIEARKQLFLKWFSY